MPYLCVPTMYKHHNIINVNLEWAALAIPSYQYLGMTKTMTKFNLEFLKLLIQQSAC